MTQELDWQRIGRALSMYLHGVRRGRADFARSADVTIRDLEALFAGQPVHHSVIKRISKEAGADFELFRSQMRARAPNFEVPESDPPTPLRSGSFVMHLLSIDDPSRIVSRLVLIRHDPQSRRTRFVSVSLHADRGIGKTGSDLHDGFVWHAVEAGTTQLVSEDKGLLQVVTLARPQVRLLGGEEKALVIKGTAQMMAERGDIGFYPAITPVVLRDCTLLRRATLDLDAIDSVGGLREVLADPDEAAAALLGRIAEDQNGKDDLLDTLHDLAAEVMPVFDLSRDLAPETRPNGGPLRHRLHPGNTTERALNDADTAPTA